MFCVALTIALAPLKGNAELLGDYVGYKACIGCHEEKVEGWKTTPHAHAFESLAKQGKEKQTTAGCVECHVVAFEEEGGFIDMAMTPELADVQCESCHGPGKKHVESEGDPSLLTMTPSDASCRNCHTIGQDRNFNFDHKKRWVHQKSNEPVQKAAASNAHADAFFISSQNLVFGNLTEGVKAQKEVRLKNIGKDPVKIVYVKTN